jgi:lysophospholipid acyltransferase (LPLAT)-like uncharacterized protein
MLSLKSLGRKRWVQVTAGTVAAEYLRLVEKTSRFTLEPADGFERFLPDVPVILALWHGQHFVTAFGHQEEYRSKVLISRHRDGEINAIAAERLGLGTIRGSGNHGGRFDQKGGVSAFQAMMQALRDGYNVILTADVPKVSRVAGLGIVMLARASGRPIFPVAFAASRRFQLNNWDKTTINLPFSRGAAVIGEPIRVPEDADNAALEIYRQQVESRLNAVTERAYAIVDKKRESRG